MKDRYRKLYKKDGTWCFESDSDDEIFYNNEAINKFDDDINIEYINKCEDSYFISEWK